MTNDRFSLWNIALGRLLPHLSDADLPGRLQSAINSVVPYEHLLIYGYRLRGRPIDLHCNPTDPDFRNHVQAYIAGSYHLDPFYHQYQAGYEHRFYPLKEIIPDDFETNQYNLTHYARTGIFDEVVLYVGLDSGLTAAMSLTRNNDQKRFTTEEISTLDAMVPVISALIRQHWVGTDLPLEVLMPTPQLTTLQDHIDHAFGVFGRSLLTDRESEVIGLILRGYSSTVIGSRLGISVGTVKIHRKNAYHKLNISSQSELFSRFIQSLSDPLLVTGAPKAQNL